MELVDTSVWGRKDNPLVRGWFRAALIEGDLAICDMVALEILRGATTPTLFRETSEDLIGVSNLPMNAWTWTRARQVYDLLQVQLGNNLRLSVRLPDLLIAACAEQHRLPIVHYDRDYDTIARVTGQRVRWAAKPGTI